MEVDDNLKVQDVIREKSALNYYKNLGQNYANLLLIYLKSQKFK
ncbi:8299_t:CDS:2 [Funneliformis mosseae]|uniref:8299_t:CDS:1 n=1 Tax=Funneliformis mosseae TaxID=27381 RepID=A0A9N8WML8_FUNMO|nr:8299_t:CDS:2 [Funneliformis mosseae]